MALLVVRERHVDGGPRLVCFICDATAFGSVWGLLTRIFRHVSGARA